MSTMTAETEQTETPIVLKEWTSSAGPNQLSKVKKSFAAIRWENGAMIELNGIREKPETHERHGFVVMFGGSRQDVKKAQFDLGEMFGWTITRENYQDIIDTAAAMLEVIKANTPVKDCLKSQAEVDENDRLNEEYRQKREAEAKLVAVPVAQPGNQTGIHWRRNEALGGIEIVFPQGKPTEEQRSRMKGYRFQWKKGSNYWWARFSPDREHFATKFCGQPDKSSAPDATDIAYEDQCQQMTGA